MERKITVDEAEALMVMSKVCSYMIKSATNFQALGLEEKSKKIRSLLIPYIKETLSYYRQLTKETDLDIDPKVRFSMDLVESSMKAMEEADRSPIEVGNVNQSLN